MKINSARWSRVADTEDNTVECITKAPLHMPVQGTASAWFNKQ